MLLLVAQEPKAVLLPILLLDVQCKLDLVSVLAGKVGSLLSSDEPISCSDLSSLSTGLDWNYRHKRKQCPEDLNSM